MVEFGSIWWNIVEVDGIPRICGIWRQICRQFMEPLRMDCLKIGGFCWILVDFGG